MKKLLTAVLLLMLLVMAGCGEKGGEEGYGNFPISLKGKGNARYDKGFDEGYAKGYAMGNEDCIEGEEFDTKPSFNPAYDDMYEAGYDAGYWAGYNDGFRDTEAMKSTAEEESPPGTSKADDYGAGYDDGYQIGYLEGKDDWVQGWGYYESSPTQELIKQYCYSRSDSYIEGFVVGYEEGYVKGWNELEQPENQL